MIELMVVIAIISILAAFSIPVMNMFGQNDLRDSARLLSTLLKSARMYAVNHNVETAVVYFLDDPYLRNSDGSIEFAPMEDSITNKLVRTITAATVMYRLPANMPVRPVFPPEIGMESGKGIHEGAQAVVWQEAGTFVPAPGMGDIIAFPDGYSLLLNRPLQSYETPAGDEEEKKANAFGMTLYDLYDLLPGAPDLEATRQYLLQYNRQMERERDEIGMPTGRPQPLLEEIGMRPVYVYPETPFDETYTDEDSEQSYVRPVFDRELVRPHMAHVFTPRGALKTRLQGHMERYTLMVAPMPSAFVEDRIIDYGDGEVKALGAFVEINRGTGYVRVRQ